MGTTRVFYHVVMLGSLISVKVGSHRDLVSWVDFAWNMPTVIFYRHESLMKGVWVKHFLVVKLMWRVMSRIESLVLVALFKTGRCKSVSMLL